MYEHLRYLTENSGQILSELSPLPIGAINKIRVQYPDCPTEYLCFLEEWGVGALEQGEMFFFEEELIDAETELFFDKEIYKFGASGPIKFFGADFRGINYGFDTGERWRLVRVEPNRLVTKLKLEFFRFVEGIFICYPHYPFEYRNGNWILEDGEEYSL